MIPDKKTLNKFILKLIIQNHLPKRISMQNSIKINEQFLFNIFPIKRSQKPNFKKIKNGVSNVGLKG